MRRAAVAAWAVAVFAATAAAFLRSADCALVNLDDYDYLPKARQVEMWGAFDLSQAIWMPLTWASYRLDMCAAGDSGRTTTADAGTVRLMHLHNVALHGANAALLFLLLCEAFRGGGRAVLPGAAALAALLWALHPLRVESVAWVASRKDVLSGMWLLASLLCWARWRRRGGAAYWASIGCFALGAAAKPSVMCLPALAFVLDVLVLGVERRWRDWRFWAPYALPCAMAAGIAALAGYAQHAGGAMTSTAGVPLWWRLLNAATAAGMYVKNTVWPADLCCQCYMRWPALPRGWWFGVPACAACAWWVWRRIRGRGARDGRDPLLAGALWFGIAVAPMLGVVGFGGHAFADRFTYIPAMGLGVAAAALAARVAPRLRAMAWIAAAALAALSWRQVGFWRDDGTLWERTLAVDGDTNYMAHSVLGTYHFEFTHDLDACIRHYERSIELNPGWSERTGVMYLIALAEAGRREKLQDAFLKYNAWFRDCFGVGSSVNQSVAEAAYQLGREDPSSPPGDGCLRAEQIVEEAKGYAAKVPETGYIRYLVARRRGKSAEAEEIARKLVADRLVTFGDAYLRFRFLERTAAGAGKEHGR